ncbi:Arginyl-tRNA--protein transferase [gamma proteobacterium HdN1]|nr:Arginyl-tRNA--protein transferase [gamma proteobacterium HdN1]
MTDLSAVKFFVTPQHKCSYLPRQDAATLFADPKIPIDHALYSELSELGFRRSGNYLYRPHCRACAACIPVRVPVASFTPTRKHRRIFRKNEDLKVTRAPARFDYEYYELYARYIEIRHSDGDMYPPSPEQFSSFLLSQWGNTFFLEFRKDGKLLAVAVCDEMLNGLSAVYTFYAPEEQDRSLGVYSVLWQIEEARKKALPALYLGYWIKECQKMSYKAEYQPLEIYINNRWTRMS